MVLYRYYKACYSEHLSEEQMSVWAEEFKVLSETPKGYWFDFYGRKKWTSSKSIRRFAYPTKREALENFIKRQERSILINKHKIEYAKLSMAKAKNNFEQIINTPKNQLT